MAENRFKPPTAELRDPRRAKGSAVKGLLLGAAVDVGGSIVLSVVLAFLYAAVMAAGGQSEQAIHAALANSDSNPWLSGAGIVGGCAFSTLGGYACERVARQRNYRLGIVLSCIMVALGLVLGESAYSVSMNGLLAALTAGSILLGTRLGLERNGA